MPSAEVKFPSEPPPRAGLLKSESQPRRQILRTPKERGGPFGSLHRRTIHAPTDVKLAGIVKGAKAEQGPVDAGRVAHRRRSYVDLGPCIRSHHVTLRTTANDSGVGRNSAADSCQATDPVDLTRQLENGAVCGQEVHAAMSCHSAHFQTIVARAFARRFVGALPALRWLQHINRAALSCQRRRRAKTISPAYLLLP